MNRLVVVTVAALAAFTTFADSKAKDDANKRRPTAEQIAAHRAEIKRLAVVRSGGYVSQPMTGGVIRVANTCASVSDKMLNAKLEEMRKLLDLPVTVSTDATIKTGFLLEIKNAGDAPAILTAPEDGWAQVNVDKLSKGSPSKDVLEARVVKETWRAIALGLGAGYTTYTPDLMMLMKGLPDLDRIGALSPCPASYNQMIDTAMKFGVQRTCVVTYRVACRQGWAPQPTNDIQRAIWKEVHDLPSDPVKIKFDPKTDK